MGEFFALLTGAVWAAAVILLKRSGEHIPPFPLNLFRVGISTVLLVITVMVSGEPLWGRAPLEDYLILFASGIIAIGISDTLFHLSLNMVGAGISAIVDCLYSPFVVLLAFGLLQERLGSWQLLGMALVLSGVLTVAWHKPPAGTPPRQLVLGVLWGVLSMLTLALGIVIAKPVLNRSPVLWATAIRQVGCLAVLLPIAVLSPRRRQNLGVFRPTRTWRVMLPGAVMGSYFSLLCWIAGMKYAKVGVAAILNQSSTIYVLILAAIFLKEPFTRRKIVASAVALAGILLVTFS
jgi:drug/metabolite transporter (DMT)-like permease